uniref:Uncharacterized protein n=1 Tax=Romanomermis culicivorax TaxID=13658 RepID=A0A915J2M7_ROMCU
MYSLDSSSGCASGVAFQTNGPRNIVQKDAVGVGSRCHHWFVILAECNCRRRVARRSCSIGSNDLTSTPFQYQCCSGAHVKMIFGADFVQVMFLDGTFKMVHTVGCGKPSAEQVKLIEEPGSTATTESSKS